MGLSSSKNRGCRYPINKYIYENKESKDEGIYKIKTIKENYDIVKNKYKENIYEYHFDGCKYGNKLDIATIVSISFINFYKRQYGKTLNIIDVIEQLKPKEIKNWKESQIKKAMNALIKSYGLSVKVTGNLQHTNGGHNGSLNYGKYKIIPGESITLLLVLDAFSSKSNGLRENNNYKYLMENGKMNGAYKSMKTYLFEKYKYVYFQNIPVIITSKCGSQLKGVPCVIEDDWDKTISFDLHKCAIGGIATFE